MAYRKHAPGKRGGGAEQELLYDPDVPTPTHAERARTLVARVGTGTLCSVSHTKNLEEDSRASLLAVEPGDGDPLARGRVTLIGSAAKLARGKDGSARRAFLATHPGASYYVDVRSGWRSRDRWTRPRRRGKSWSSWPGERAPGRRARPAVDAVARLA